MLHFCLKKVLWKRIIWRLSGRKATKMPTTNINHPLCPPVKEHFYSTCISHISAKKQKNNPNMKWYKMIYERGSLERRSSSWKSNKHPLPMGWTRRWYVQEAFSQDDHVLNRLPLLKYSWAEIYSLIFHYLLPLLCILQEFSPSAAHSHFHLPPWRSAEDAFFPLPTFSSLCHHLEQFFFFLPVSDRLRRRRVLGFFLVRPRGLSSGGVWVIARHRAYWSFTGSLHQRRCLSPCRLASTCQYGWRYDKQNWQRLKKIQASSVDWTVESRQGRYLSLGAYKWETKINEFYAKISTLFFEGKKDQFIASLYWLDLWNIFPFMKEF